MELLFNEEKPLRRLKKLLCIDDFYEIFLKFLKNFGENQDRKIHKKFLTELLQLTKEFSQKIVTSGDTGSLRRSRNFEKIFKTIFSENVDLNLKAKVFDALEPVIKFGHS